MFGFFYNLVLLAAAVGEHAAEPSFYDKYLNYPGFEAWKFVNLAIFVALLVYLVKKPLTETFKAKRDAIRAELIRAEEAKQAALSQLMSAEAKLASLDMERAEVMKKAKAEAEAEKTNIAQQTESEIEKMREQADGEITRLAQQTRVELRRYSADESIRIAEEKLRAKINAESDATLVKSGIKAIGGLN